MNGDLPAKSYDTTLAFSPEAMRRRLYSRVQLPEDLLNKAIAKLYEKLDAKETRFFSYRGEVVATVDVEDHATQMSAIREITSMNDLHPRNNSAPATKPHVAVEIRDGVLRLVIGETKTGEVGPTEELIIENQIPGVSALETPQVQPDEPVESPIVIKKQRGVPVPPEILKVLYG